jgi:hypothetical protein
MRKLIFLLLPLALLSSCDAPTAETAEANPDKFFEPETSDMVGATGKGNSKNSQIKPGDPMSPFNADKSLKSQFPGNTLLRLNDIVRGSKAAIDEYDQIRPGIEKLVADAQAAPGDAAKVAKARKGLDQIRALQAEAIAARKELSAEGQKLVDSKQYYDQVVFSGMATFVTKVEDEFADDLKAMSAKLKS